MKEKKGLIRWIRKHKTELLFAGLSVATIIMVVLGIKNRETIMEIWNSLRTRVSEPDIIATDDFINVKLISQEPLQGSDPFTNPSSDVNPFEVSKHVRNLAEGRHASPEKIASALENGFVLSDGQTWVKTYMKGDVAA